MQSNISTNGNLYFNYSPALASPLQLHLRSSDIRFLWVCNLDPSYAQFTVGFTVQWECNATADLIVGRAQVVIRALGSSYKYRWSPVQLLLWGPVPNRPQTGRGPVGDHLLGTPAINNNAAMVVYVNISMHFSLVYIQKWKCWVIEYVSSLL